MPFEKYVEQSSDDLTLIISLILSRNLNVLFSNHFIRRNFFINRAFVNSDGSSFACFTDYKAYKKISKSLLRFSVSARV